MGIMSFGSHVAPKGDSQGSKTRSTIDKNSGGPGANNVSSLAVLPVAQDETLENIKACMARDGDDCLDLYVPASDDAAKVISKFVAADLWHLFCHSKESYMKKLGAVVKRGSSLANQAPPGAFDAISTATIDAREVLKKHRFGLDRVRNDTLYDLHNPTELALDAELEEHLVASDDTLKAAQAALRGAQPLAPPNARERARLREAQSGQ